MIEKTLKLLMHLTHHNKTAQDVVFDHFDSLIKLSGSRIDKVLAELLFEVGFISHEKLLYKVKQMC